MIERLDLHDGLLIIRIDGHAPFAALQRSATVPAAEQSRFFLEQQLSAIAKRKLRQVDDADGVVVFAPTHKRASKGTKRP